MSLRANQFSPIAEAAQTFGGGSYFSGTINFTVHSRSSTLAATTVQVFAGDLFGTILVDEVITNGGEGNYSVSFEYLSGAIPAFYTILVRATSFSTTGFFEVDNFEVRDALHNQPIRTGTWNGVTIVNETTNPESLTYAVWSSLRSAWTDRTTMGGYVARSLLSLKNFLGNK
jgi:hypothetical protein